jgi:hypothetical protein
MHFGGATGVRSQHRRHEHAHQAGIAATTE